MKTSWILLLAAFAGLTACDRHAAAPPSPIRPVLSIIVAPEAAGGAAFAGRWKPVTTRPELSSARTDDRSGCERG